MRKLILVLVLALLLPGCATSPRRAGLPGLNRPVTVLRDPWGIPHIYAETQEDLFFAQGFVAAQDRLFQMELWRRAAEGRMAEILGPKAVERDRVARLIRYRGDMDAEYASYAPDARQIIESFVRGVNAYIASLDELPVEFKLAGFRPEPWTPEVCLSRVAALGVTGYAQLEVFRGILIRELGAEAAAELVPPEPSVPLEVPPGLDLKDLDFKILAGFRAAGERPSFPARNGSNNWVVDGTLSATGKPLLANDPHRALAIPSLRWMVHLVGPGWNVIGAGEPALPGVAAGHNDRVAFGFTIVGIDQQDLYAEETHPEDPNRVRFRDGWVPMRIEKETIKVKGAKPVEVELKFTEHGPVLYEDPAKHRAWALRWVGSEPGTAGYLASLSLNRARTWPEFLKALERWKVPSENLVYADVDGNIGWKVAGLTPVRSGWNGLLPVPGNGNFEWQGFLPAEDLPGAFNPAERFLATANHNILPPGYDKVLGFDWGSPERFQRIVEVLSQPGRKFSVADFERLQHDEVSLTAREMVGFLTQAQVIGEELRPWVDRLEKWDKVVSKDSDEAALYEVWLSRLPKLFAARQPEKIRPFLEDLPMSLLRNPTPRWFGEDPVAGRDAILVKGLQEAVVGTRKLLGEDPAKWR
ncbi:MAG TPA: penicillin acylase family protein, partial [Thermoanaerobaculia bacterium]|nr:penicillin acylase family protein [Thermoanaerobaculia bacterium]